MLLLQNLFQRCLVTLATYFYNYNNIIDVLQNSYNLCCGVATLVLLAAVVNGEYYLHRSNSSERLF